MIQVTRSLLRRLRSVFRKAGVGKTSAGSSQCILFQAGSDGLRVRAMSDCVAVEYHEPGTFDAHEMLVPPELLAAAEGRSDDPVTLDLLDGRVLATWTDGGIPQRCWCDERPEPERVPVFPALPEVLLPNPPELRTALAAAANIAPRERSRYALDCLQLRPSQGKLVSTDGRQILVQSGFQFPGSEDVLVSASPVFGCRELATQQSLAVGMTGDWVGFQLDPWTVWLRIERTGQFPKIDDLIRSPSAASSRIAIDAVDADFLLHALPRLPSDHEQNHPLTVELNGRVALRARAPGEAAPTELVLARSGLDGQSLTLNTDRRFLLQALELGFREVYFFGPRAPALCDDGHRQYLWALLEPEGAIHSSDNVIRIEAPTSAKNTRPVVSRRRLAMAQSTDQARHGGAVHSSASTCSPDSVINRAVALRTTIREVLGQANALIGALKREKRHSRLVASTLASLKQLQKVAG